MTKRIFIVENHEWAREALARLLELQPGLDVCGIAASAEEALEMLPRADADVLLTDISLGRLSGIDLIRIARERWPQIRCMVLSNHSAAVLGEVARDAGSMSYVEKGDGPALLSAIETVLANPASDQHVPTA